MLSPLDTIVALSTPPGRGVRALVRVSGSAARAAVESLVESPRELHRVPAGCGTKVRLRAGALRIEVWVGVFRAPRSYTREDLVEIWLPGSPALLQAVIGRLCGLEDVRRAGPGEFTLRAFRNGRIDLSRAEAVGQIISARSETEARAARRALEGELSDRGAMVREELLDALARLEASLDFPDEDLPLLDAREVVAGVERAVASVRAMRRSTRVRLAPEGTARCVIAGHANAGKSSLLNRILGREAALVSPCAGTTRDPVRGVTEIGDQTVEWLDLAGIARPGQTGPSGLESGLCEPALASLRRIGEVELTTADLILWIVDPLADVPGSLRGAAAVGGSFPLLVASKVDLLSRAERARWRALPEGIALVSGLTGEGVRELLARVGDRLAGRAGDGGGPDRGGGPAPRFLVSAHQEAALSRCEAAARRALDLLRAGGGPELASADLRDALGAVEDLVGRFTPEDVLERVFSRFCVGK